jgi:hypothetical protein
MNTLKLLAVGAILAVGVAGVAKAERAIQSAAR